MKSLGFCLAASLLLVAATPVLAEGVFFEATHQNKSLQSCDILHQKRTCDDFHIIVKSAQDPTRLSPGDVIDLEGRSFKVSSIGPGYYVDGGVILRPVGETEATNLSGQQWVEDWPNTGASYTSSFWSDRNADGLVSRSDTLTLDSSKILTVKDVRMVLWAEPID